MPQVYFLHEDQCIGYEPDNEVVEGESFPRGWTRFCRDQRNGILLNPDESTAKEQHRCGDAD